MKAIFLLLLLFALPSAWAGSDVSSSEVRRLESEGKIMPLQRILNQARLYKPGRVIDIELEKKKDVWIYELELLEDSGAVWEMKINAATGGLIKLKEED